ncbi:MAG: D-alanyl-D-alanine carboxypeptidase family protein [Candidatus Pristimantibacillus lignocellulolyticus]|uniref:D-alanyl-D-alanine carboxypeptidase family protein n=1 Tax=Candidatus Pristimantibacillus lignocellulolyticus TaxID=2994561 RepID=A0A9J6ZC71_9BACL|nr:MAG: D-alanyl-D-alanine carboxypeptidase family protein [Candidatus Pristimantibacillus lignocellulolyticus]
MNTRVNQQMSQLKQMRKRRKRTVFFSVVCVVAIASFLLIRYDNSIVQAPEERPVPSVQPTELPTTEVPNTEPPTTDIPVTESPVQSNKPEVTAKPEATAKPKPTAKPEATPKPSPDSSEIAVIAKPSSIGVLVNKQNKLPDDYNPADLVYPDVAFIFNEKIDKRKMRKEAAGALEEMFAAAKKDSIHLAGVSAYRSHATQTALFERYVKKDGLEKARTYSAYPGTSEHETGLSIDVSGSDGKCAAEDCFGDTDEAVWLEKHAPEYGYIIRYPKGQDAITGYKYEPWHIRYVGKEIAQEIADQGITLEEYYGAIPVSK